MKLSALLFPAVMIAVAVVYEVMAIGMPRGSMNHPGPGLYPMIVGVFLLATALGCLAREILRLRGASARSDDALQAAGASAGAAYGTTVPLMGSMVAYVLALQPLGFPVCICIFLLVAIRIFGFRRWVPALGMAVALTAVSYVAFVMWLKVPLPLGILDDVLG
ncbi:MAG: tripartite tricarboxylate transporter TctB family protein [Desulfobacteraceae bacterium]|nr:MAG: tripartite tricarboxylate transporter TctB family protein [Desulfobacteraceae bacterium]